MRRLICFAALTSIISWGGCAHDLPRGLKTGAVSGTVLDEHGVCVESSRVSARGIHGQTLAHPDGSFLLEKVPAGTHTVFANAPGFVPDSQQVLVSRGGTSSVHFVLSEAGLVVARGTISGTIVDPRGYEVGWALVTLKESPRAAMTDPQGHFSINRVPVGIYTLRVSLVGFARATRDTVRVEEGRTTTVDVPLEPQAVKVNTTD